MTMSKVEIFETGNVGELMVENYGDVPVFIQAGDIVKGGRQDRVLRYDIVVKPKSGKVPIQSFCVEQGRWSGRGDESTVVFGSSDKALASKELKLAAKATGSQSEVWAEVADFQSVLVRGGRASEVELISPTSLQLTLENSKIKQEVTACVEQMTDQLNALDDVVGFAFAINGELNSADIYGEKELFTKMWPKLIEAAVTEAKASPSDKDGGPELTADDVEIWLAEAEVGATETEDLDGLARLRTIESRNNVVFETELDNRGVLIHKNVIKK
jgi:hypothetical protein